MGREFFLGSLAAVVLEFVLIPALCQPQTFALRLHCGFASQLRITPPPLPEAPQPEEEPPAPEVPSLGAPSSSLELLASLTPEAFSLDSSLRGKQRMSKHNFLQAHNGQGLRAARPADDPLSLLDPLWTLNKT